MILNKLFSGIVGIGTIRWITLPVHVNNKALCCQEQFRVYSSADVARTADPVRMDMLYYLLRLEKRGAKQLIKCFEYL